MANGTPDFRFKSQFPIAGVANLISNKRVKEEQIRASQSQQKNQQIQTLLQAINVGSQLATSALARSTQRQTEISKAGLADAVANLTGLEQRQGQTFLQSPIQQFGRQGQPTQAISPTFDKTEAGGPEALQAARANVQRQATLVSPGSRAQAIIQPRKQPTALDIEEQKARIGGLQRKGGPKARAGAEIVPDEITVAILRDIGKKDDFINNLKKQRDGKLELTQKQLDTILKANGVNPFNILLRSIATGRTGGGGLDADQTVDNLLEP